MKKKPDIEYGIAVDGSLHIWCNCNDKKKGMFSICGDCAKYFTDKLQNAIDPKK